MPYGQSALNARMQAGDPFLGGLLKGALNIAGGILPGPLGGAARLAGGLLGGKPKRQPRAIAPVAARFPGFSGMRLGAGLPGIPRVGAIGQQVVGLAPRRRRMNYSNPKALRRSLRRVTGYARQQKSVRKAAQEFAREFGPKTRRSKKDSPPGHTHVR